MTKAKVCGRWIDAPDGDYFVICSFDPNHVILRSRMPYHILKCLQQHPNHNKKQCPYDATEYIDPEHYEKHILTCESMRDINKDSDDIERLKASGELERLKPTPYHFDLPECDEDWGECDDKKNRVGGMGRGSVIQSPPQAPLQQPQPKKGMGRGQLLRMYQERYAKNKADRSSSASSGSLSEPGQFDD